MANANPVILTRQRLRDVAAGKVFGDAEIVAMARELLRLREQARAGAKARSARKR